MAWYNESKRHSDAAKGRKTGHRTRNKLAFKAKRQMGLSRIRNILYDKDVAIARLIREKEDNISDLEAALDGMSSDDEEYSETSDDLDYEKDDLTGIENLAWDMSQLDEDIRNFQNAKAEGKKPRDTEAELKDQAKRILRNAEWVK